MNYFVLLTIVISASILPWKNAYGGDTVEIIWKPQNYQPVFQSTLVSSKSEKLAQKLVYYKGDVSEVLAEHLLAIPTSHIHDELASIWNRAESIETKQYWDKLSTIKVSISFEEKQISSALQLICDSANENKSSDDDSYLRFYYAGQISGTDNKDGPVVSLNVRGATITEVIGKLVSQTGPLFRTESNIICVGTSRHNIPTLWKNPAWNSVIMEFGITPKNSIVFLKEQNQPQMKQYSVKKLLDPTLGGLLNDYDIAAYDKDHQRLLVIIHSDAADGFKDILGGILGSNSKN